MQSEIECAMLSITRIYEWTSRGEENYGKGYDQRQPYEADLRVCRTAFVWLIV